MIDGADTALDRNAAVRGRFRGRRDLVSRERCVSGQPGERFRNPDLVSHVATACGLHIVKAPLSISDDRCDELWHLTPGGIFQHLRNYFDLASPPFVNDPGVAIVKLLVALPVLLTAAFLGSRAEASDFLGPDFDWSGVYFGVNAGLASNDSNVDNAVKIDGERSKELADRIAGDQSTLMGGGLLGYNIQIDHIVFGAEADLNYLGFSDAQSEVQDLDVYSVAKKTSFDASWLGTLRGRLGYTSGGLLIYGTAGLAGGDMEAKASVNALDVATGESVKWKGSTSTMNWGWTAGAGLEYGISNVSFGLEYLYVDLGSAEWDSDPTGTIPDIIDNSSAKGSADYQFSLFRATAKLKL